MDVGGIHESPLQVYTVSRSLPEENHIYYLSSSAAPVLEIIQPQPEAGTPKARDDALRLPFVEAGEGRTPDEYLWAAELPPKDNGTRRAFRIDIGDGEFDPAESGDCYETSLRSLWLQDGQIYSYRPAPEVSASRVIKVPYFQGSLPTRPLYVYLPRGYAEHTDRDYPVIFMQDGQNVFETYVDDSYVGSWRAEEVADRQIQAGRMQECLIVGVSHGGEKRIEEYLPPYATIRLHPRRVARAAEKSKTKKGWRSFLTIGKRKIYGRADRTFEYYRDQVVPFLTANYRLRPGRENTALCGSSMGGLFSMYVAWENPDFAYNFAALSPSFSVTAEKSGRIPILEHMQQAPLPDIRLWLDSGAQNSPGVGDDDFKETLMARDLLLEQGMVEGDNFAYLLDRAGLHNEASWSARLPQVFEFLFPAKTTAN